MVFFAIPLSVWAESSAMVEIDTLPRPVTSVYRLEIGGGQALATYLSPLKYNGTTYAVTGQWSKAMVQNPQNLIMTFDAGVSFRDMSNESGMAQMLGVDGKFAWGIARRWQLPYDIQASAGGNMLINGGLLYLARNGNNPVAAHAYAGVGADLSISKRFKIGRVPTIVADRLQVPCIGAFFMPEYGETYYEIWLGNRRNLAHCGWWGNHFAIDNMLSLTLDLGRTALEVGYRYDMTTAYANKLDMRVSSHAFCIGVIPQGIGLKRKYKANYAGY